jgi:NAD(P)-dependent dehydrogenase (short-subunit alcohol dehydrogenase family)
LLQSKFHFQTIYPVLTPHTFPCKIEQLNIMARIFITGSSDGLGQLAAQRLIREGHSVVLHARNTNRAEQAKAAVPKAEACLIADLSSIEETKKLAAEANAMGKFDAVIHNAGLGFQESSRAAPADQPAKVFAVNSLAPYILTCLMTPPKRLVYVSSGLHTAGIGSMEDLAWLNRPWNGFQAYADSKLHNVLLANAVARKWPDVPANSVSPGWVATKMGGSGANDSLEKGPETQVWLATDPGAEKETGKYWYHMESKAPSKYAEIVNLQEAYLKACERISGVKFPDTKPS